MADQTLQQYLEGLLAKRAALDAAIAQVSADLGVQPPENGGLGIVAYPPPGQPPTAGVVTGRVSPTEFFRMSVPEAVIAYLEIMKQPQTPKAIADGLKAGGILSEAKHFYANVFTALKRLKAAEKVVNTKRGWAPSWWFEGRSGGIAEKKPKRHQKGAKGAQKAKNAVTRAAAATKKPRSGYHAFLAEQLKAGKTMKEAGEAWSQKKGEG